MQRSCALKPLCPVPWKGHCSASCMACRAGRTSPLAHLPITPPEQGAAGPGAWESLRREGKHRLMPLGRQSPATEPTFHPQPPGTRGPLLKCCPEHTAGGNPATCMDRGPGLRPDTGASSWPARDRWNPHIGFSCTLAGMLPASSSTPCLHVHTQTHAGTHTWPPSPFVPKALP